MPRTLVTGGTGFIGSHVARLLAARGDELRLTVRETSRLDAIADLGAQTVRADVLDRRAMRRAMRGVERVFHVAGSTDLRLQRDRAFAVNVEGTRIVLEEALRAGVERVVFTSSVAAIGPAPRHRVADESQAWDAGRHRIPYVDAKHEAEVAALRLVARGLPLVIVNPAHVLGPGDPGRSSTTLVRRFLRRQIPAYVEGTINIVGVEDVARGHLQADRLGAIGERYILGNRNFTFDRLFADLARISGVEPPALKLPFPIALAIATAAERLPPAAGLPRPPMPSPAEVRAASLNWAFRNTRAKRELRWKPSPHEDCLESTIAWYRERDAGLVAEPGARQPLSLRVTAQVLRRTGLVSRRIV